MTQTRYGTVLVSQITRKQTMKGLSDSSIKENAVKGAFEWYIDVHISDDGHFCPFLATFGIHLGYLLSLCI
jgi:hypothetical protein